MIGMSDQIAVSRTSAQTASTDFAEAGHVALDIRLFGSFKASVHARPLGRLRSPRIGQYILALLALRHGREVERAWLAATLWPDSMESQALYNLNRNLTDLRHALGSEAARLLSPTTRTLRLELTDARVDLLLFDAAVGRDDLASLELAVALHRAPLLEGCTEEWVLQERLVREQACCAALERLADLVLTEGATARAVAHLRRLVAADPLRESAHRLLMRALAAAGEYAAVIQVYRDLRLLLHRDLRAEPDPETTALYRDLRAQARRRASRSEMVTQPPAEPPNPPSVPAPRFGHLPRPLTSFVGREDQIWELKERLRRERLLTLTGPGGIGKTRLALQVAREMAGDYAHDAWFVDLAPLSDGAHVAQAVARTLDVREQPGVPVQETLRAHLQSRSTLLILDNCEHLAQACALLAADLLAHCSELQILATSREPLHLNGEQIWRVPTLPTPHPAKLSREEKGLVEALLEHDAVRLFVERARLYRADFMLTPQNAAAVVQICHTLDGLPLAVELAAVRVNVLPVQQIAARLKDRFQMLIRSGRTLPARHQTLQAMLDWSYDLLGETERELLRRLSVFAGGSTLEAAAQVCGHEEYACLDLLSQLVERSLLIMEEAGEGTARYRMLETIRQYGRERLEETGEAAGLRARHRDYYASLAETARPYLIGPEQTAWLERLEAEHDNLRAALNRDEAGDTIGQGAEATKPAASLADAEADLRMAIALRNFWEMRNHFTEGRTVTETVLSRGRYAAAPLRAAALSNAGVFAWMQADFIAAQSLHEESLTLYRQLGDRRGMAVAAGNLGLVAWQMGDHELARTRYEENLAISRELGSQRMIATSLTNLGVLARQRGDYAMARTLLEQGLDIDREQGDKDSIANSLTNLSNVLYDQGDYAGADALCREALVLYQELGNRRGVAAALHNLGSGKHVAGDHAAARSLLAESLILRQELQDKSGIADSLEGFARLAAAQGQWMRAATLLGAEEAWREAIGALRPPVSQADDPTMIVRAIVHAGLNEAEYARAQAAGRAMDADQAIAYALGDTSPTLASDPD